MCVWTMPDLCADNCIIRTNRGNFDEDWLWHHNSAWINGHAPPPRTQPVLAACFSIVVDVYGFSHHVTVLVNSHVLGNSQRMRLDCCDDAEQPLGIFSSVNIKYTEPRNTTPSPKCIITCSTCCSSTFRPTPSPSLCLIVGVLYSLVYFLDLCFG